MLLDATFFWVSVSVLLAKMASTMAWSSMDVPSEERGLAASGSKKGVSCLAEEGE